MNFIKDCRYSAISVALVIDGRAEFGVVYNPYADELRRALQRRTLNCYNGQDEK